MPETAAKEPAVENLYVGRDTDENFDDVVIGDGASGTYTPHVPGLHKALIVFGKPCEPSDYNPEKPRLLFEFGIEGEKFPVRYWVNRALGFSKLVGHSNLAKLISAATGIPLGSAKITTVKLGEVVGRYVLVRTELNAKGYPKIVEVLPLAE
jgi:hypothetical protein